MMSEPLQIWLYGGLAFWNVTLTGALLNLKLNQVKMNVALEMWFDGIGKKAAKLLHSPDNHHGLDPLLDKVHKL